MMHIRETFTPILKKIADLTMLTCANRKEQRMEENKEGLTSEES